MKRVLKIAVDVPKDADVDDLEKRASRAVAKSWECRDIVPLGVFNYRIVDEMEGLSTRTLGTLKREKIRTIGDLVKRSREDMLAIKGFGMRSFNELAGALENFGLGFKA